MQNFFELDMFIHDGENPSQSFFHDIFGHDDTHAKNLPKSAQSV